jgi:hypothetical protein
LGFFVWFIQWDSRSFFSFCLAFFLAFLPIHHALVICFKQSWFKFKTWQRYST